MANANPDTQEVRTDSNFLHDQIAEVPRLLDVLPDADLVDRADRALFVGVAGQQHQDGVGKLRKIGRASCRERVSPYV